jgi:DNA repair protein RecN (Recombination protein N)
MLQSLRIRNLAIVEDLRVEFGDNLNVITGETGAGKSVMIGALNLILGDRADKSLIRFGADQCSVEAVFAVPAPAVLEELGIPDNDGSLIIRRIITAAGTGKCFVNDSPATAQALKRIGDALVDMHGPHDHQSLFSREFQLDLLDAFGGHATPRQAYADSYRHWQQLQSDRVALAEDGRDPAQEIEFLSFQVREIQDAKLTELDEEELQREHTRVANAQRILELTGAIHAALTEDETSAFSALASAQKPLGDLAAIVPEADTWKEAAGALAIQLQELDQAVTRFAQQIDADPARLQELDARLAQIHALKRKYGGDVADILAMLARAKERLEFLQTRGERAAQLDAAIATAAGTVEQRGKNLRKLRQASAKKLAAAITNELRGLGFAHGSFAVTLTTAAAPGPSGMDEIEFAFAPNVGEPARPLRQIASSGEMSRVMLATKVVLAEHDKIPVLVFDEIDANVGGEMGNAIGEKLRAVSVGHQVICITHLPQVAVQGRQHFVVTKDVRAGRTSAGIQPVTGEVRTEELARMLGGRDLTSVTLKHAKEMLKKAGRQKMQ